MLDDIKALLKIKPGLKGRQIAKKIGEDRKAVNSFLSKNLDSFEKDDDHCWTLKQVSITKIEFPSKWVDEHAFEESLKPLNVDSIDSLKEIHFIFPEDCKFLLIAIARFLALANQLKDGGYNITIDMGECRNTLNFFSRNGFFDYLYDKVKTIPARPKSSLAKRYQGNSKAMLELGDINPNERNKELIIRLGERFIENSSEQYALAAKTVFSELIGNVKDHSDSKISGLAASCEWTDGISSNAFDVNLPTAKTSILDIGCSLAGGAYVRDTQTIRKHQSENNLMFFLFSLLGKLQSLGTVAAIDWNAYANILNAE